MFTNNSLKLLILLILFNLQTPCQLLMGFAPLQPGNFWKYIDNYGMYYLCSVRDSTIEMNGMEFYVVEMIDGTHHGYFSYCTLTLDSFYVAYDEYAEDSLFKYLKYNCQKHDVWTFVFYFTPMIFAVVDTWSIPWFNGELVKAKYISTQGFLQIQYLWNDTLGLLSELHESGTYFELTLVGCVINGIAYGDTSSVTSVNEEDIKVEHFTLEQNYPNPFNPATSIPFSVPYGSNVKLVVHNVLGEEIRVLVDEYKQAGEYRASFEGSNLPSGIYIYTLMAANQILSKQMILLK